MIYILKQFTSIEPVPAIALDLQMFADAGSNVIRTTTQVNAYTGVEGSSSGMSTTMKTYYDTELLENARDKHYFAQFGKKQPLPAHRGKTIEWRKWNTLPKADILTEGVIPTGKGFGQTAITANIKQYGMYVSVSDQLELHALDNVILGATEELGASAGDTQDVVIRNVLMEGTNVMYCDTLNNGAYSATPTARYGLSASNNKLTPDMVNKVQTEMKKDKVPKIGNKYIALIHPSCTYDLRNSAYWIDAHKYANPTEIYNGEIGELHGVRFIETDTAPVLKGAKLNGETAYLTLGGYTASGTAATATYGEPTKYQATISETPTADHIGRWVHAYDASAHGFTGTAKIVGVDTTNKYLFLNAGLGITYASGDLLYPGEATYTITSSTTGEVTTYTVSDPQAVYATLFFGADAYGIIDPAGAGMEMIIKSKEQAGGPLNQFSTMGYKFSGSAKILYQERLVRVESCSSFSGTDDGNYGELKQAT